VYALMGADQFGRRDVVLGQAQSNETQIVKGISPGDKVVGDGSLFLQVVNSLQH
jgi:multidrug efflux pump subunit AcrA (membrane-fusion protein)